MSEKLSRLLVHGRVTFTHEQDQETPIHLDLNILVSDVPGKEYTSLGDISKIHQALAETVNKEAATNEDNIKIVNILIKNIVFLGESTDEEFNDK